MPKVSVVMSVYNAEAFLKASIESILNQTFKDFEFIIVNDGSTDQSLKIIQSYPSTRIIVVNQTNQGLSRSLNNAIKLAKGKYIARQDADDISENTRLSKQVKFLEDNIDYVLVGSNATYIDVNGNKLFVSSNPLASSEIKSKLPNNSFFHSSVVFKKESWIKAGGYNEEIIQHFEDKLLWNEFAKLGELKNLSEPLIHYRLVPTSISNLGIRAINRLNEISNKIILTETIGHKEVSEIERITIDNPNNKKAHYHLTLASIYLNQQLNRKLAFVNLIKCLMYSPLNKKAYINLTLCLLPKRLIKKIRTHLSRTDK